MATPLKRTGAITVLVLLAVVQLAFAASPPKISRTGPVYTDVPGKVSAVVELPSRSLPKATSLALVVKGRQMSRGREIRSLRDSGKPLALVLCVDSSLDADSIDLAKAALSLLLGISGDRPKDRLALIAFADDASTESSFSQSRDNFIAQVTSLRTRGAEARVDRALLSSLDLLQMPKVPLLRRIILFSGGKVSGSVKEAVSRAKAAGVPTDVVKVGAGETSPELSDVARVTGGRFVEGGSTMKGVNRAVTGLYDNLMDKTLVIDFDVPAGVAPEAVKKAKVEKAASTVETAGRTSGRPAGTPAEGFAADSSGKRAGASSEGNVSTKNRKWPNLLVWLMGVTIMGLLAAVAKMFGGKQGSSTGGTSGAGVGRQNQPPGGGAARPSWTPLGNAEETSRAGADSAASSAASSSPAAPAAKTEQLTHFFTEPRPGQPTAFLKVVGGRLHGQRVPVEKELFYIGTKAGKDLQITDDEYVSGNHAYLRYESGTLFVIDENSTNGTSVNEQKLAGLPVVVSPGDVIQMGNTKFQIEKP